MAKGTHIKLTKGTVDAIQANGRDFRVFDSELPGYHVRVRPNGTKTYALKYRYGDRQKSLSIGQHGVLTPDQARVRALELLAQTSQRRRPCDRQKTPTQC
ncbi:MAG: Arm DNA-binding domain-containing protein [Pseudomonadota bacterium]